jgi:hypothetical protein
LILFLGKVFVQVAGQQLIHGLHRRILSKLEIDQIDDKCESQRWKQDTHHMAGISGIENQQGDSAIAQDAQFVRLFDQTRSTASERHLRHQIGFSPWKGAYRLLTFIFNRLDFNLVSAHLDVCVDCGCGRLWQRRKTEKSALIVLSSSRIQATLFLSPSDFRFAA